MADIQVKELTFGYAESKPVLQGISLSFDGRSTAIIGQNGAGKTTFVKLLKGLLKPTAGDVLIDGQNTREATVASLAGRIGMVFQNPNDQIFKNKVLDEVMFGPLNIGMSEGGAKEHAEAALALVGLCGLEQENPYDLSLSERKMVAIASILAMDTGTVIFDEPTIAQDWRGRRTIGSIIRGLRERGKLVIAILHDMDFVAEYFERTVVFAKGRVLLDGGTREVFAEEECLRAAYLEPPHVTQLCKSLGYNEVFLTAEDFVSHVKGNGFTV
ncbi:energy-coupling factor ABC transporter ATP-binding protein [Harryflintia acetispora]|uniref:energy-coupling factor ABC transporter ATP-binding protein n=1 Tax=Harryflintia acetispora TaxID=1849041 RepID=UPI00189991DF|nr:ABC transporter ATP-binding protein [Harryflintia acetispora]